MNQPRLQAVATQRLPGRRSPARPSCEDQVFAALLELGGAAHVDEIVQRVTLARRRRGLAGGPPVRLLVESALHHMRSPDDRPQAVAGARVYRPFGVASRRWAVCRDHAAPSGASALRRPKLALI